jgi:hypothetical protein
MRKGKFSNIRMNANAIERNMSKKQRRDRNKRYLKYAAMEREAERPPRVKRNGIEIN